MNNTTNDFQNKKKALGRGLGSLLGGVTQNTTSPTATTTSSRARLGVSEQLTTVAPAVGQSDIQSRVWQIPIEKIVPSSLQPRTTFDKEKLQELAASIKQSGILQPIVARKQTNGSFEIIAGERRWRAAQIAGMYEVPVIIKTLSNLETLELAIVENIQREDLSALEEAEAYQRLSVEFKLTQQQIAEKVGKERATVANAMRLLSLSPEVREMLKQGQINAGHAKVLLGLENKDDMIKIAKKVFAQQLSVRALEKEINKSKETKNNADENQNISQHSKQKLALNQAQEELQKKLGTKVSIDYRDGVGKIQLNFYSDEEFTSLIERLKA